MCKTTLVSGVLAILATCLAHGEAAQSVGDLEQVFAQPPRDYSTGPLWVWNDMMTEEQVRSTLNDLASQDVKQVWVHPRPGLMTPYLSDEWFRLWEVTLDEAERLDMNAWIYDENSYPSGFAGGFVPEAMPESRGMGIAARNVSLPAELKDPVLAVYGGSKESPVDVTEAYKDGSLAAGEYVAIVQTTAGTSPWFGGKSYVDLLKPGVTEKFLELTLEPYRERFGDQFGKRIPGSFTDEPHLSPASSPHWTPDLPEQFEKRWGYDLREHWMGLWEPVGDWRRVRHNYYKTLLDLFVERWAKPYYEYCERNSLEFTGHYWEHSWPDATIAPDNMAMYAWHQRPAIDTLFNQYNEDVHSQFGNVRAVLELSSVANQMGWRRTLCEAYGGSGWDARFEDFKRIGDWLQVLGVNTINEHLSHVSTRGARKTDYPPSFSYQAPWFGQYHVLARHFTRLSAAMSHGEQINEILLIEPTSTAWMYQRDGAKLDEIGQGFQRLVTVLAQAQVEFDLGCEDIIARHGSVAGGRFVVGRRGYHTVVIPAQNENLNGPTVKLLESFVESGGTVLCMAADPMARVDGQARDEKPAFMGSPGWKAVSDDGIVLALLERMGDGFKVVRAKGDPGILYHHRRQFAEGDLVLLVNTSIEHASAGSIDARAGGVALWDTDTGEMGEAYPFAREGGAVKADFEIAPCGSLLLFMAKQSDAAPTTAESVAWEAMEPGPGVAVKREGMNVLTLDYVDVTAGGESKEDIFFYQASEHAFRAHGLDQNPWDHAVQFRDELISKTFPEDSGFEAAYKFTIREEPPAELYFALERADLYEVTCNGLPVGPTAGEWWRDRACNRLDISKLAKTGENRVEIKARPFTMFHEIQPAYVLGSFALEPVEKGFEIVADKPLELGSWKNQGHPLYGEAVSYAMSFAVPTGAAPTEYEVFLPAWSGSVASVRVNGQEAGAVWHAPWRCPVTQYVREGDNEVTVTVVGTPKNTLGPHHGEPPLGFAGPNSFRVSPKEGQPSGAAYHTLDYGLFEPFQLLRSAEAAAAG